MFLKPGVPHDPTGERVYTYRRSDYCSDESEVRQQVAGHADHVALLWLSQNHAEDQPADQVGAVDAQKGRSLSPDCTLGTVCCAYCSAASSSRVQLLLRDDDAGMTTHALTVVGGAVAVGGRSRVVADGGPRCCQPPTTQQQVALVAGQKITLLQLSPDTHRHLLAFLAPGDATRLSQTCRGFRQLCAGVLAAAAREESGTAVRQSMLLSEWRTVHGHMPPMIPCESAIRDALGWLGLLRHVSLLTAIEGGGSMAELMADMLSPAAAAVVSAGGVEAVRLNLLGAEMPHHHHCLQLFGLQEQAELVAARQRRRGANRSELLRLCAVEARMIWANEAKEVGRPAGTKSHTKARRRWCCSSATPRPVFGMHSLCAQPYAGSRTLWREAGERIVVRLDTAGAASVAAHTERCPAQAAARAWWAEHWRSAASDGAFAWCFGRQPSPMTVSDHPRAGRVHRTVGVDSLCDTPLALDGCRCCCPSFSGGRPAHWPARPHWRPTPARSSAS